MTQAEHSKAIGGLRTDVDGLRTEVDGLRKTQLEHGRILQDLRQGMVEVVGFVKYLMNERGQAPS